MASEANHAATAQDATQTAGLETKTQAPSDLAVEAPKSAQINGADHVFEEVAGSNHQVGDVKLSDQAQAAEASPAAERNFAASGDVVATAHDAPGPAVNLEQKPDAAEAPGEDPTSATAPEQPMSTAALDEKPEPAAAGEKRELNAMETTDATEANIGQDQSSEPIAKKQKIKETNGAAEETDVMGGKEPQAKPETNGDNKPTRSKSKKVKDALKQVVATDSIGSRTRSRTKSSASN